MPQGKRSSNAASEPDDGVMKKKFRRKLERQLRKIRDPRRYLVVSNVGKRWFFYYCVDTHTFVMNEFQRATAFKSKKIARAVKKALGKRFSVVTAKKGKNGRLQLAKPIMAVRKTTTSTRKKSGV